MSRGPDEDEELLREAAEKAERLAEQLMADAAGLAASHPEQAEALQDTAAAAREAGRSLRETDAINEVTEA